MGVRGPVPKRTSARLGHLTKAEKDAATKVKASGAVEIPKADPSWHPLAAEWFASLGASAQRALMEPSDWAAARLLAHEITRMLAEEGPNAAMLGRIWTAMGELMTTEGARRRLKVEVERRRLTAVPAEAVPITGDYANL